MSYDVDIGGESFNYTFNVSKLFYDHIPQDRNMGGLHELHGLTGKQAAILIGEAFRQMCGTRHKLYVDGAVGEPLFCKTYDAPNGWGSAIGGMLFLASIMAACVKHPRSRVSVSI